VANLWQALRGRSSGGEKRYSFSDWANDRLIFQGLSYPLVGASGSSLKSEWPENSFPGFVQGIYKSNGVAFATILSRILLFSEARFQWQRINNGRPGDLFGTQELSLLETPWPNGTTGELLARMEQDVSLAGNFYAVNEGDRLRRLRPDWVEIVLTAAPLEAVRSNVAGYHYRPGGTGDGELFLPEQVCHWSPIPDPVAQYRGMSWLTPVVRELQADGAATDHKLNFFRNAATPNLAVSLKEGLTKTQFVDFVDAMDSQHRGVGNAYKTLYTANGADVTVVGADMKQLDFKQTQGAGETRICAAGGVPPIIVGLSEGLHAATYSNYGMARRKFGDHWARPQWRSACAALSVLVTPPQQRGSAVRLWYDDRDIAFLREDEKDRAEIQGMESRTIRQLLDAGYKADTVITAVTEGDWTKLEHTGLFSVQLQPPRPGTAPTESSDGTNPANPDGTSPADPASSDPSGSGPTDQQPDDSQDGGDGNPA
jgi:phage portal protein BeeE